MLKELRIENFAIIQKLDLQFDSGLVTFTGETGAGKSILLDAITALVGGKTDPTFVRAGAERAILEGVFTLPAPSQAEINAILEHEDLLDEPGVLVLGREIRREGRSTGRINGRSVAAGLLRTIGEYLVDIHGQSEHLSLLNVRQHLGLLDRYAASEPLHTPYHETYRRLLALRRELNETRQSELEISRRADLLAFQADEIEAAHLLPGEEDDLRQERNRLANAENLSSLARQSLTLLEEGSPESPAITDLLGQVVQLLTSLSRIDNGQEELSTQAETLEESLSEITRDLQDYLERIEFNPRRLEQAEERLELLHSLKRKYGGSVESALAYAADARQKLENLTHAGERIQELEKEEQAQLILLAEQGRVLSQHRRNAAEGLGQAVEAELDDLHMAGARFVVDICSKPDPHGLPGTDGKPAAFDEHGLDQVEFLIAPNPGEGLKPLVKIASGGETSRLMLAIKNVLVQADAIPTLIFDEIDQGIGGRVGSTVGEKLWQLGRQHQVLCVTHLPQLAAFGDQHWRVRKEVDGGRTLTIVEKLEDSGRMDELAQMLGALTEVNRTAARETLEFARLRTGEIKLKK